MDAFEDIVGQLLDESGYWVMQSVKINLTPQQKKALGKPTMPRPEIDIIAFNIKKNTLYLLEVKSYLDSNGVDIRDLAKKYKTPTGHFKILTCPAFQKILSQEVYNYFYTRGLIKKNTGIKYGLVAGQVKKGQEALIKQLLQDGFFWGPSDISKLIRDLSNKGYEDNAVTMTVKILNNSGMLQ